MRHRVMRIILTLCAALALSPSARAQEPTPLARFVTDLVGAAAHIDAKTTNERTDLLVASQLGAMPSQLNQALGFQLATFPIDLGLNTSKPGFESVPSQYAFGPAFSVHAGSVGRGKVSVSFNYQNTSFGSLDGIGLDSGQMGFVLKPPASLQSQFGRDVLHEALSLRVQQDTATFGIVYGATDRLEIGIGVPIVHLELEGQIQSQVYRALGASPSDKYFFDVYPVSPVHTARCISSSINIAATPDSEVVIPQVGTAPTLVRRDMVELDSRIVGRKCDASGLGDVVVHGRVRVTASETNAVGISVDARLPTGDADQLLGTGGTRTTAAVAWSGQSGRFLPHASVGYTFSVGDASSVFNTVGDGIASPTPFDLKLPDEINFAAGTDIVFFRRLTIAGEAFGRRIKDLARFRVDSTTAAALSAGDPLVPGTLLQSNGTGATLLVGVGAAQVALTDRTVLKANVMFPLFGDGLKPRVAFGAGLGFRY
jgi:hypothetical protein